MHRTRIALIAVLAWSLFLVSGSPKANDALANSVAIISPFTPSLHNLDGKEISGVEVGQQAVISVPVHNNVDTEQSIVVLVEVRDGNSVTEYLAWQSATIASNSNYTMGISWTPYEECGTPSEAC